MRLNLSKVEFAHHPFPHFIAQDIFPLHLSLILLEELERHADWKIVKADFYEQYELNLCRDEISDQLSLLVKDAFLQELRSKVGQIFGVQFSERMDVTAHKLILGQQIEIHNDYIPNEETHRLLVQLNHGWTSENGGELLFYKSANPDDIYQQIAPYHNCGIGFAISADSHHAVTAVRKGKRFTLVFSFYKVD